MRELDIRRVYDETMKSAAAELERFPWLHKPAYAGWLAQSYYFVCHSTRLLGLAAAHANLGHEKIHRRMGEHISEELGHEALALKDLKNLGERIEDHPEQSETKAFWRSQYYLVEHHSPVVLMGYILFLEGISATKGPTTYAAVSEKFGKRASMFWKVHAEEDQDHIDKAFDLVDDLDQETLALVASNLRDSAKIYYAILRNIEAATNQYFASQQDSASPEAGL